MTNRQMSKGALVDDRGQNPNTQPLPPMPAPEDAASPTTREEPIDSPQPNPSQNRLPPGPGRSGLATRR